MQHGTATRQSSICWHHTVLVEQGIVCSSLDACAKPTWVIETGMIDLAICFAQQVSYVPA